MPPVSTRVTTHPPSWTEINGKQTVREFVVVILGDWEIVDRLGTRSRTCYNEYALCDPSNTLTTTVRFICVSFRGGNPEERVAGGKNAIQVTLIRSGLSQNGNGLKADGNMYQNNVPRKSFYIWEFEFENL